MDRLELSNMILKKLKNHESDIKTVIKNSKNKIGYFYIDNLLPVKYVKSLLDFLEIDNVNLDELLVKIRLKHDKFKANILEKNLKKFIKPQTFNKNSKEIKKKLNISDIENFITKNLPK